MNRYTGCGRCASTPSFSSFSSAGNSNGCSRIPGMLASSAPTKLSCRQSTSRRRSSISRMRRCCASVRARFFSSATVDVAAVLLAPPRFICAQGRKPTAKEGSTKKVKKKQEMMKKQSQKRKERKQKSKKEQKREQQIGERKMVEKQKTCTRSSLGFLAALLLLEDHRGGAQLREGHVHIWTCAHTQAVSDSH